MKSESSGKEILESIKNSLVETNVTFKEAWNTFIQFPKKVKLSGTQLNNEKSIWDDFSDFCKLVYNLEYVSSVGEAHAIAYTTHVREKGRFSPITYKRGKKTITNAKTCDKLSSRTLNSFLAYPKMVFEVLLKIKHVIENPFNGIERLKLEHGEREIYTPDEVQGIILATKDTYLYPLMIVGCLTGLRRASICHLKWEQINFETRWIGGKHEKTGAKINIPLSNALYDYLLSIPQIGEYCFPELFRQYDTADYKIREDWKKVLNDLGIKNQEVIEGRSRKVSTKDIHSLRHTFASIAIESA